MAVKDNEKNKAYVAKHRETLRATLGNYGYKKREVEARALRRKKRKGTKGTAGNHTTTPKTIKYS